MQENPETQEARLKSIVVLSGGQDSVTTAYLAAQESEVIGAVHFAYGQKHAIERECAQRAATRLAIELTVIDVPAFTQIGHSALLEGAGSVNEAHPTLKHLPASFVPGRNLIFLTLAAALAMKLGAPRIYTGVCEEDYSGYPDCRDSAIRCLEITIQAGMDFPELEIVTPLMKRSKAATFAIAESLGVLDEIIEHTHTCYVGDHQTRHEWGYGCGTCPSCEVRAKGYTAYIQKQ
jgi:7-cyano-7-deazaguanine synthase